MFWNRFVLLCNEKNKSPNAVCAELGLSVATATKWKQGAFPRDTTMKKIADYFGTSVSYLSGLTDNPDPLAYIFPIEKDPALVTRMREIMQGVEENKPSEADMAMEKFATSIQDAVRSMEEKKPPSMLERLATVVKSLSKDDLEELGRYAEYLASKKQ